MVLTVGLQGTVSISVPAVSCCHGLLLPNACHGGCLSLCLYENKSLKALPSKPVLLRL